jgi:hypothetical protein
MKRFGAVSIMVVVLTGTVFPATVGLCGFVKDAGGKPLANAVVRLGQTTYDNGYYPQAPYMTMTDTAGHYALGSRPCTTGVAVPILGPIGNGTLSRPRFIGGKVSFGIQQELSSVKISLFTLSGRFVRDVINNSLSRGAYSVAIDMSDISSQYYLLRVTVDGATTVLKMRSDPHWSAGSTSAFQAHLEKVAAVESAPAVDTLHVTVPGYKIEARPIASLSGQNDFALTKNNTWNGDTSAFWGSGYPVATGGVTYKILNRTNGVWPDSQIYWDINGGPRMPDRAHRLDKGSAITVAAGTGSRFYIYIAPFDSVVNGTPKYCDWVEQAVGNGAINGNNLTRVDGWRLPIATRIRTTTANIDRGDLYELFFQPRKAIFDEFVNEVPKEFSRLATVDVANIYAPHLIERKGTTLFGKGGPYVGYFDVYQDSCRVHNPTMPAKSTAWDIFACAGNYGNTATWGGNMNRHVGTLPSTQWCDSSKFYRDAPCNYFSKWCHLRAMQGLQYGFPYDDDCNKFSGIVATGNVQWFAIAIGW